MFAIYLIQDDVDKFMEKSENSSVEEVLKRLDEQHSKYKFFEYNLITKRKRYSEIVIYIFFSCRLSLLFQFSLFNLVGVLIFYLTIV